MTLLQRLRILIGYDLSDEAELTAACREHLDARARAEETASLLKSALEMQQAAGEHLARLSASGAGASTVRQAKDQLAEALARAGAARAEHERALAAQSEARTLQKQRFEQLARTEGVEQARAVVREALEDWWADRIDDGQSWWKG